MELDAYEYHTVESMTEALDLTKEIARKKLNEKKKRIYIEWHGIKEWFEITIDTRYNKIEMDLSRIEKVGDIKVYISVNGSISINEINKIQEVFEKLQETITRLTLRL